MGLDSAPGKHEKCYFVGLARDARELPAQGGGESAESLPILTLVADLRRADELMRSSKPEEQEKGQKLLKETLRRLR